MSRINFKSALYQKCMINLLKVGVNKSNVDHHKNETLEKLQIHKIDTHCEFAF